MANPFVAEIRIFACNFAPSGWAFCAGQLMSISQNTALFSLIGTFYGGDGKVTFGLPDLRGHAPVNQGTSSASGTNYVIGEVGGVESYTALLSEMPAHSHQVIATNNNKTFPTSTGGYFGVTPDPTYISGPSSSTFVAMSPMVVEPTGAVNPQPHENRQPHLAVNFCIALTGIFPPRG